VLAIGACRLSRNGRDGHTLTELCGVGRDCHRRHTGFEAGLSPRQAFAKKPKWADATEAFRKQVKEKTMVATLI